MRKLISTACAVAFAAASTLAVLTYGAQHPGLPNSSSIGNGFAAVALADNDNHGHDHHVRGVKTNDRDNDNDNDNDNDASNGRGNPHNCINPAGNMRGWCKHHNGATFYSRHNARSSYITGTVLSVNGNTATVRLSNGQIVTINDSYLVNRGQTLRIGQAITLRGYYQNGVFVVNNGAYTPYTGPYSSSSVRGLIISINGNSVQIAQGLNIISVNDSRAANNGAINGALFVGRTITAYGNWSGNVFYANSIQ